MRPSQRLSTACIVLVASLFAHAPAILAVEPDQIVISYSGWETLSRHRWSLDEARAAAKVLIRINDSARAAAFLAWLEPDALRPIETAEPGDARLVIDLYSDGQILTTYYADRFYLYTGDSLHRREIDDAFRLRFRFGELKWAEANGLTSR